MASLVHEFCPPFAPEQVRRFRPSDVAAMRGAHVEAVDDAPVPRTALRFSDSPTILPRGVR